MLLPIPRNLLRNIEMIKNHFEYFCNTKNSSLNFIIHQKGHKQSFKFNVNNIELANYKLTDFNVHFQSTFKKKSFISNGTKISKEFDTECFLTTISDEHYRIIIIIYSLDFIPVNNQFGKSILLFLADNKLKTIMLISKIIDLKNNQFNLTLDNHYDYLKQKIANDSDVDIADFYQFYKSKTLASLLNTLKHELSNPLFGINSISEIMSLQSKNEFFNEIKYKSKLAIEVINNCNKYYSNDKNKWNLINMLNQTLIMLKSVNKSNKIICNFNIKSTFTLTINKTWCSQIIINLILNSIDATNNFPNSNIFIDVDIIKNNLFIRISDNGIGINKEKANMLFKKYYTTKSNGNGLGLYISKTLANKMNGDLIFEQDYHRKNLVKLKTSFLLGINL